CSSCWLSGVPLQCEACEWLHSSPRVVEPSATDLPASLLLEGMEKHALPVEEETLVCSATESQPEAKALATFLFLGRCAASYGSPVNHKHRQLVLFERQQRIGRCRSK